MSARVNLAPEVYQNSQRSKRRRQLAITLGLTLGVVCGAVLVVSLVVLAGQYAVIAAYTKQIKDVQQEIQQIPDLQKAVTVQQHLNSWDSLQQQLVYSSKFYEILQSVTPQELAFESLSLKDPTTLETTGVAKNYTTINKLAKALEASNVDVGTHASPQNTPHFADVLVLSANQNSSGGVEFKLNAKVSTEVMHGN
jgi:Tfp pilus assembly protein PilN